jgi:ABC-type Fe3+ transport system permease subunit
MNDQLQKALTELANKLGTSVQYLWKVLVSQAKTNAITDILMWVVLLLSGFVLYFLHKRFSKTNEEDRYSSSHYDNNEPTQWIMAILGICWLVLLIACFVLVPDLVSSLFNPQYWALKEIVH